MARLRVLVSGVFAFGAHVMGAQSPVPIVNLPGATAKTAEKFVNILGIRQNADGTVLVNVPRARQITLYDSTLAKPTVVVDSSAGSANSYGGMPSRLVPYMGDSSLFADANSQTLLVVDARGRVARAIAPPGGQPFGMIHGSLLLGTTGVDNKGRLVFQGPLLEGDSRSIVRADFALRQIDTIGRLKVRDGGGQVIDESDPGKVKITMTINPLPAPDAWAVLTDGSVAIVRGHDYHIDWIHADGTRSSSPKLPFDWKRLTDDDKQKLIDSSRAAQAALAAARGAAPGGSGSGSGGGSARGGGGSRGGDPDAPARKVELETVYLPLKQISDYYPAIRPGAALADRDGNVWILPTTSAQSQKGELVYDVVNRKDGLFERVRIPLGRSVAGFGKGGVVYLAVGDRTNGFYLERTRLPGGAAKK
jgi:hypothetical protein